MVDGVNDGVSFVDNTLTTLAASVRDRGVPGEKSVTNEILEFNASVSKRSIWAYPFLWQIYSLREPRHRYPLCGWTM